MLSFETIALVAVLAYLLYKLGTYNFDYWAKQGIAFIKPLPFVGCNARAVTGRVTMNDNLIMFYKELEGHRYGGIFDMMKPALILRDPELVKQIAIKDFDYFPNHRKLFDEHSDVIFGKNLFALHDQRWRDMRNTLSPAFTSSKMKNMFSFINKCGSQLSDHVRKNHKDQNKTVVEFEFKELFTRFANDVIATAAFGIEVDSLSEPNNQFYLMGKDVTNFGGVRFLKFMLIQFWPLLAKALKIKISSPRVTEFFSDLVHGTIRSREEKNIVRPDMIHLLMEARKGTLDDKGGRNVKMHLSDDDLTAQAVLFFIAGFDTASTFLSFAAYELAVNPDIQQRLFEEVQRVEQEDGGQLTYEGVMNKMEYLDMICNETLRIWPPAVILDRVASKRYVIPASERDPEVVLEPGDTIFLPVAGFHLDPKYFPEPEIFNPERFSPENKGNIVPHTYIPFGIGPRNCIGNPFALMEGKLCLVHLVKNFTFEVVEKTQIPLKLKKFSFVPLTEKGVWLGLKARK